VTRSKKPAGERKTGSYATTIEQLERATGLEPALRDGLSTGLENQRGYLDSDCFLALSTCLIHSFNA
jgi:hypothetical protein